MSSKQQFRNETEYVHFLGEELKKLRRQIRSTQPTSGSNVQSGGSSFDGIVEIQGEADSLTRQEIVDAIFYHKHAELSVDADAGYPTVIITNKVASTCEFAENEEVQIKDKLHNEKRTISSIVVNELISTLTLTENLTNNYLVSESANVTRWAPYGFDEQTSALRFHDTATSGYLDVFLITSSESNDDPLLVVSQGAIVKKDLAVGGFIAAEQGTIYLGHGMLDYWDKPNITLLSDQIADPWGGYFDTLELRKFHGGYANLRCGGLQLDGEYEIEAEADSMSNSELLSAIWHWTYSALTSNASSGQKNVAVTNGALFYEGQIVSLMDTDCVSEVCEIDTISTNTLTMVANLANTYTTAKSSVCIAFDPTGFADQPNKLRFSDTISGYAVDAQIVTSSGNNDAPLLTFSQGVMFKKDVAAGGFLATEQGAVFFMNGLTSPYDPPRLVLSSSSYQKLYITKGYVGSGMPTVVTEDYLDAHSNLLSALCANGVYIENLSPITGASQINVHANVHPYVNFTHGSGGYALGSSTYAYAEIFADVGHFNELQDFSSDPLVLSLANLPKGTVDDVDKVLTCNGASTAPTWETASGGTVAWGDITDKPLTFTPSAHNHAASDVTSGTFDTARIPSLAASIITSGTFDAARIPSLAASKITSDTFDQARIPWQSIPNGGIKIGGSNIYYQTSTNPDVLEITSGVIIDGDLNVSGISTETIGIGDASFYYSGVLHLDDSLAIDGDLNVSAISVGGLTSSSSLGIGGTSLYWSVAQELLHTQHSLTCDGDFVAQNIAAAYNIGGGQLIASTGVYSDDYYAADGGSDATFHGTISNATYATTAGSAGNADTVDGSHASAFASASHNHGGGDITSAVANASACPWSGVTDKPSTFTPSTHTHAGTDVTSAVANASAVPWSGVTDKPSTFAPAAGNFDNSGYTIWVTNLNANSIWATWCSITTVNCTNLSCSNPPWDAYDDLEMVRAIQTRKNKKGIYEWIPETMTHLMGEPTENGEQTIALNKAVGWCISVERRLLERIDVLEAKIAELLNSRTT